MTSILSSIWFTSKDSLSYISKNRLLILSEKELPMKKFNPSQKILFPVKDVFNVKDPLAKYETLFFFLNLSAFKNLYASTGRPRVSYESILKALIFKNLRGLSSFSDLVRELSDNQELVFLLGLNPEKPLYVELFSAFLKNLPHHCLEEIKTCLIIKLIDAGEITGQYLSFDSTNIPAKVKENNLKTSIASRFDKTRFPKGDPDCRLGVMADAALDSPGVLSFILDDLKAAPYIPQNLRNTGHPRSQLAISPSGKRVCLAGFEMLDWGKFKEGNRIRRKFVCPITHSKKFSKHHPSCSLLESSLFNKKNGCTSYIQVVSDDIRKRIEYGTEKFKKMYNMRTGSERIFSRLLSLCMNNPSVRGLNAVSNHATIAHITVLLVALAAIKSGNKDKTRFVKSLLPFL
jgi:transposase